MSQARTVSSVKRTPVYYVNRTPVYYETISFLQGMLVVEEDTGLISAPQISLEVQLLSRDCFSGLCCITEEEKSHLTDISRLCQAILQSYCKRQNQRGNDGIRKSY